jgi:hypothetical protein
VKIEIYVVKSLHVSHAVTSIHDFFIARAMMKVIRKWNASSTSSDKPVAMYLVGKRK